MLAGDLHILAAAATWSVCTVLASAVMARVPAPTATLVTFLSGTLVVAAGFAWLTLGERWTPGQFAGAAAVLSGIALTRLRPPVSAAAMPGATSAEARPPDAV